MIHRLAVGLLLMAGLVSSVVADETLPLVEVRHDVNGTEVVSRGRILVTAADGGVLLETRDGQYLTIKPDERQTQRETDERFVPYSAAELGQVLRDELGSGFEIVTTRRYVIASNAGRPYAEWCGRLLERLHTAFLLYWKRAGLELAEPAAALPVIVFATPEQFAEYAVADAGPQVAHAKGYYSIRTNRVILCDLTRVPGGAMARTDAEIERRLDRSLLNVATVVHEATHQIAFNCGLHTRYADNPMWVTEGMAMFFEAPDLRAATGWRTIGKVHPHRLGRFQSFTRERRPATSLSTLLVNDDRFRDPSTSTDAYAESWALTFFLIREHRKEYIDYLRRLSTKPRLIWDDEATRMQAFEESFGQSPSQIEDRFLKFAMRLRHTR